MERKKLVPQKSKPPKKGLTFNFQTKNCEKRDNIIYKHKNMDTTTIVAPRKNTKHNNINNVKKEHECNNSTKKGLAT